MIGEFIQQPDHGLMFRTSQNEPFKPYKPKEISARTEYKWSDFKEVNGNMSTIKSQKIKCDKCEEMFAPKNINTFKGKQVCMGCLIPETIEESIAQGRRDFYDNSAGMKSGSDCHTLGVKLRAI